MPDIVMEVDIAAPQERVVAALATEEGIKSWWTDQASVPDGTGSVMQLDFAIAPVPFELRVDEAGPDRVAWTSVGEFPPHWVDTEVSWALSETDEGGTRVLFRHANWDSYDGAFPRSAFTWGQLLGVLKTVVESGKPGPLFVR